MTLLEQIERMTEQALMACGSATPSADKPPAYQWGLLQGKYFGLLSALKAVRQAEEDESEFQDNL